METLDHTGPRDVLQAYPELDDEGVRQATQYVAWE